MNFTARIASVLLTLSAFVFSPSTSWSMMKAPSENGSPVMIGDVPPLDNMGGGGGGTYVAPQTVEKPTIHKTPTLQVLDDSAAPLKTTTPVAAYVPPKVTPVVAVTPAPTATVSGTTAPRSSTVSSTATAPVATRTVTTTTPVQPKTYNAPASTVAASIGANVNINLGGLVTIPTSAPQQAPASQVASNGQPTGVVYQNMAHGEAARRLFPSQ